MRATCKNCHEPVEYDNYFQEWQHPGWADPLCDPTGKSRHTWAEPEGPEAYKVIKDSHVWDYSTHWSDIQNWRDKIFLEEPDSEISIEEASIEEMLTWKSQ